MASPPEVGFGAFSFGTRLAIASARSASPYEYIYQGVRWFGAKEASNRYPLADKVVKCERNYRRNHLRWYRITRIKRGRDRGRRWRRMQETGTNEHTERCTAGQRLQSNLDLFAYLRCTFLPRVQRRSSRNTRYSVRTVRTRSSSVIDRNLSLTSLPPGAKILPGAQHGPDPRATRRASLGTVPPRPVRPASRFLRRLPACSMIIRPAGSPSLLPRTERPAIFIYTIDQPPGRDLYL